MTLGVCFSNLSLYSGLKLRRLCRCNSITHFFIYRTKRFSLRMNNISGTELSFLILSKSLTGNMANGFQHLKEITLSTLHYYKLIVLSGITFKKEESSKQKPLR